jgi:hypothetical protein
MLITSPQISSTTAPRLDVRHEFTYPRVRQIAPRAHTVLASSLGPRSPDVSLYLSRR